MHRSSRPGLTRSPYLPTVPPEDDRPLLFCFPHAGGAASAFRPLAGALADRVNVVGVQLPGREGRRHDPLPADLAALVAEIDQHLDPYLDRPHSFYGHSLGALIAYDLAERRRARGARPPVRLLVGACRAPHLPPAFASARLLGDGDLQEQMIAIGGMSEHLLSYPDWIASAIALTRGDLHLCASRRPTPTGSAPYPVDAFYGFDDPLVTMTEMAAWSQHVAAGFTLHGIDGGHFFQLGAHTADFAATVESLLVGDRAVQGGQTL